MKSSIDFKNPNVIFSLNKTLIQNSPVAYIILDKQFRVHFINDFFLKLRKLDKKDVLGRYCYSVSNRGVPCSVCAVRDTISTQKKMCYLRHDILPDGTERYLDDYAIPLYKKDGKTFDYILEIMQNRTEKMILRRRAQEMAFDIIKTMSAILESKDSYTSTHSSDVSLISMRFARYLKIGEKEIYDIGISALLHDIGKIYTPLSILHKSSRLTEEEYKKIKAHPTQGANLIGKLEQFSAIQKLGRYHHERWDGKGYPEGLVKEQIPLGARIISIADAYDAMTSDRPYRKALSHQDALKEIKKQAGIQFDPALATKFFELGAVIFTSREKMISSEIQDFSAFQNKENHRKELFREVEAPSEQLDFQPDFEDMNSFVEELGFSTILENSPFCYSLVSSDFDVLFISKTLEKFIGRPANTIVGTKCYEGLDADTYPTVLSFKSKTVQNGQVRKKINTKYFYLEITSVPIELIDQNNQPVSCVMEMFFDRTLEVEMQKKLDHDFRSIINVLEGLIGSDEIEATASEIAQVRDTCAQFIEYLSKIDHDIKMTFKS